MGTNYYLKQKGNDEFSLHVGKMSCGWRFSMCGYLYLDEIKDEDKPITITLFEDYIDLLKRHPEMYLEDEYGDEVNIDELFDEIKKRKNQGRHTFELYRLSSNDVDFYVDKLDYDVSFGVNFC